MNYTYQPIIKSVSLQPPLSGVGGFFIARAVVEHHYSTLEFEAIGRTGLLAILELIDQVSLKCHTKKVEVSALMSLIALSPPEGKPESDSGDTDDVPF